MVRGILADINVGARRDALVQIWSSDLWRDLWNDLGLIIETFRTLGLSYDSADSLLWRMCQREELVLITGNRNKRGPDSLEATIRAENQYDSLPVVTIADPDRVLQDRPYAEAVAERLLDYLMRIDDFRGAGRGGSMFHEHEARAGCVTATGQCGAAAQTNPTRQRGNGSPRAGQFPTDPLAGASG
jgi:hypothetical protein